MNTRMLFALLLFNITGNCLFSNPIPLPQAHISEFMFDQNGKWILEVNFWYGSYHAQDFDSICVTSSTGFSRIRLDHIQDGTYLFVVTSDSLDFPLTFDKSEDCLKLYSYITHMHYVIVDSVLFGSYPASTVGLLQAGHSICRISNLFCKDKSPTIGFANDTVGTRGYIEGYMYDKNKMLIDSGQFRFDDVLVFKENGMFKTPIFARKFASNKIERIYAPFTSKFELIDSLYFDLQPDSVVKKDIDFIDYVVSVQENTYKPDVDLTIINYPNPFNSSTNFFIKLPSHFKNKAGVLNIYSVAGEHILSLPITNGASVRWDGTNAKGGMVASGTYYYQLVLDQKIYKNGSMVFLK